jgi:mannose-6-phosphate isomerase-like protein (cupin superfamily)
MRMKIGVLTAAAATIAVFSSLAWTQPQPGQQSKYPEGDPGQAFVLQGATVMATSAKLRKDTGNASDVYLERHSSAHPGEAYSYRIGMEHRLPNFPQNASVHEKEAELWSIIDGAMTVTTGGKLVDAKQNGTNWGGKGIQGGKANRVAKGDFLMIPEGVPHQVTAVEGEATLVTFELPRPRSTYVP